MLVEGKAHTRVILSLCCLFKDLWLNTRIKVELEYKLVNESFALYSAYLCKYKQIKTNPHRRIRQQVVEFVGIQMTELLCLFSVFISRLQATHFLMPTWYFSELLGSYDIEVQGGVSVSSGGHG